MWVLNPNRVSPTISWLTFNHHGNKWAASGYSSDSFSLAGCKKSEDFLTEHQRCRIRQLFYMRRLLLKSCSLTQMQMKNAMCLAAFALCIFSALLFVVHAQTHAQNTQNPTQLAISSSGAIASRHSKTLVACTSSFPVTSICFLPALLMSGTHL